MVRTTLFGCLLLFCLSVATQAQVNARLEVDSTQVETGNPFVLHLFIPAVNIPDTLSFSAWRESISPKNLLSQTKWLRKGEVLMCDITLIFFDEDTIDLAPLPISFKHGDTAFTNPLSIKVYPTNAPEDLNDMAPIKDISREPTLWTDYLPLALSVLGGIGVLALLFWWYSRSRKVKIRSRTIGLSPHELALKKLDALHQKALWQHGAVKAYCAELTFILREYLEKRYSLPALESTSEEILQHLRQTDFPAEFKSDLQNVLSQADLAKFAKAIPPEEFYLYSMDFAQALVTRTIPVPVADAVESDKNFNQTPNSVS